MEVDGVPDPTKAWQSEGTSRDDSEERSSAITVLTV